MMSVPCAGYRSRVEAYRALAGQGLPEVIIAKRMGLDRRDVRRFAHVARIKGTRGTPRLDEDTIRQLIPLAAERGVTVRRLAETLLRILAEERELARNLLDEAS